MLTLTGNLKEVKTLLKNAIWSYIGSCYDNDGVLPDADEIYLKFQLEFTMGANLDWIDEMMESFISIHDLTGIDIQWEGEIYESVGAH